MDIVFIKELSIFTIIGVYDWEKKLRQKLLLDIEIASDNRQAAFNDNIDDCLDYTDVSEAIIQYTADRNFALIERVAEEIATLLLSKFSLNWVRIKVSKPIAVPQAYCAGVIIERYK